MKQNLPNSWLQSPALRGPRAAAHRPYAQAPKMEMTTDIPASICSGQGGNAHRHAQLYGRFPDDATVDESLR